MKKTLLPILLACLFSFTNNKGYAQEYIYTSFTTADGLASSEILSLAKDDHGYLWIGTAAGISVYDGYDFKNYFHAHNNSLIGFVNVIKKYQSNYLIAGSASGLFLCSGNGIIKICSETNQNTSIFDLQVDNDGSLLLASSLGPLTIPKSEIDLTGTKKINLSKFVHPAWKNVAYKPIKLIQKSPDGVIYVSKDYSIYRLNKSNSEQIFKNPDSSSHDKILSLFPINQSLLFFDCSFSELNRIENGVHTTNSHKQLYAPGIKAGNDSIWYAGTSGIFCFHPGLSKASVFINTMENGILWPSMALVEKDFFWLASHDGLIKIKPALFHRFNTTTHKHPKETFSALQLNNNKYLLSGNRGNIYTLSSNESLNYFPGNQKAVPLAEIRCMYEDNENRLWMGSGYQGLAVYQNGKIKRYTKSNGLHDNSIYSFFTTEKKDLYALGDNGLSKINILPKGDISFKPYYLLSKTSQYGRFFSAIEAPDGTIWTAGEEGVFYLRNDSLIEADLLHKKVQIRDIRIDNENNIWLAVDGEGIFQCQFNGKNRLSIIRKYTLQDGLNSIIYIRLLIDKNNNIWAGSSKGITVIVRNGIHKNRILNFNEKDGFLPPGYSYLNLYKDKSGIIWATSPFGTAYFNPEDLLVETTAPKLFITGVQLLKNPVKINDTGSGINNSQNKILKLRYNNNSIRFEFSAIDYSNQENLIYFYKLDGLDDAWINGNNERTISYQNLKPGNYTFYVKALNNKGKWSEETPEFSFTIKLPFWKQWWFVLACIFAGSGILIVYIQRREKKIRLNEIRNTELEKLKAASFQYQLEIEQVINFFATSINEQNSIDDMLWDVSKNCISKLGFEDCVIYLKDEKRNVLIQKAAWGAKTSEDDKIINAIEIPIGNGIVGSVAQTGKAEIIKDTSNDGRYIPDDANRLSEIAVPIIDDGKVIGVIDSEHPEKNFYTQRHLQILTTVASLCSEKIDKMKAEQTSREKQLEVLQLNSDLANSQLTALRAQMNPHFIFNALNSIQQFVLEGNADEANRYLSRFSKLQREILNNSDQQFIPLEKEKDILEIYLELEQLRFKENFNYTIKIDDSIDTDEIMIPPMIVQPFVENAIWHGLMPKQGNKEVSIDFHLKNDTYLVCTITDNGIGREAASVIKANKETNNQHKSKGLSLVYDRLKILEKQLNQSFEVRFEDLFSDNGSARGTKVTLNLYVGYN